MDKIKIQRRSISLSNLDKIWFPKSKISKGAVIDYYEKVAPLMIAHVKNHILTLQRFPNGIGGQSFYQKNAGSYFPSWIKTIAVKKEEGGTVDYVIAKEPAEIIYLANQGALTFHAWLSLYNKLYYPDRMIFDLDPSINNFSQIRQATLLLKEIFDDLKIPSYPMTTGSHGMHVLVPLKRVHTFDQIADFSYSIAQKMIQEIPKLFTLEVRKDKRGKKIFIDTLRNRYNATSVVPYAVRPHEKAPVAAPLWWQEVSKSSLTSQTFTIKNMPARLKSEGDPWKGIEKKAISLKKFLK